MAGTSRVFSSGTPFVREGRPAEVESSLFHGDERVTQRYVLCLLRHGFQWPPPAEQQGSLKRPAA